MKKIFFDEFFAKLKKIIFLHIELKCAGKYPRKCLTHLQAQANCLPRLLPQDNGPFWMVARPNWLVARLILNGVPQ